MWRVTPPARGSSTTDPTPPGHNDPARRFSTTDEVIAMANDTEYGLAVRAEAAWLACRGCLGSCIAGLLRGHCARLLHLVARQLSLSLKEDTGRCSERGCCAASR
jgi:hypothetical protein